MKQMMYSCLLLIGLGLIITGCNKTKSERWFTEESFQTSSITIYSDGYYGSNIDDPLPIVDKEVITQMIAMASSINEYSLVGDEDQLEGVYGLWIDFNNGTIIGMYQDTDYGTIGSELSLIANPNYYLPKGLRNRVIELLKKHELIEEEVGVNIKYDPNFVSDEGISKDKWKEVEPIDQVVNERIDLIINNLDAKLSSNPYDYTENNKDYDYLVGLGYDILPTILENLRNNDTCGLKEIIFSKVCSDILEEGTIAEKDKVLSLSYPLMASIPEKDIWLYGNGEGSILKNGDIVQQFDWHPSPTPRYILPELSIRDLNKDGLEDIACILYVGSGTGVSVEELRVLIQEPNGHFIDYGHNTYIETLAYKLESRIDAVAESVYISLDGVGYELPLSEEQLEYNVNKFVPNNQVVDYHIGETIKIYVALGALAEGIPSILYTDYQIFAEVAFENGMFVLDDISLVAVER